MDTFMHYSGNKAQEYGVAGPAFPPVPVIIPEEPQRPFTRNPVVVSLRKAREVRDGLGLNPDAVSVASIALLA